MPHTVKTLEPCVSLRLSSEVMGTLLADNTDLVQGFFRTLAGRGPQGGERSVMKGDAAEAIVGLAAGPLTPIQKVLALQRLSIFSRVTATEMRHLAAIAQQVELVEGAVLSGEAVHRWCASCSRERCRSKHPMSPWSRCGPKRETSSA